MSDERKPLEPSNEEAIVMAWLLNRVTGLGDTRAMHGALSLYPLIRDWVLEEAAKACVPAVMEPKGYNPGEYVCYDDEREALGAETAADAIRAMKGKP